MHRCKQGLCRGIARIRRPGLRALCRGVIALHRCAPGTCAGQFLPCAGLGRIFGRQREIRIGVLQIWNSTQKNCAGVYLTCAGQASALYRAICALCRAISWVSALQYFKSGIYSKTDTITFQTKNILRRTISLVVILCRRVLDANLVRSIYLFL